MLSRHCASGFGGDVRKQRGEMTPKEIAALRRACKSVIAFRKALEAHGYVYYTAGAYRQVYRYGDKGKYLVKTGGGNHTRAQNKHFETASPKVKERMVPLLAYGPDYQVQQWVSPCFCSVGVRGFADTQYHNHTHEGGKKRAFDWVGRPHE